MMLRLTSRFVLAITLMATSAQGVIIYSVEDYPAFQNGHNLSGTITTTNSAPNDGLLMSAEIVNWCYTVTGPDGFSITQANATQPEVTGNVSISPTQITIGLPVNDGVKNELAFFNGSGNTSSFVRYLQVNDIFGAGIIEQYDAQTNGTQAWQTFPLSPTGLGGIPWVVATAVPEPNAFCLLSLLVVLLGARRRTLATRLR